MIRKITTVIILVILIIGTFPANLIAKADVEAPEGYTCHETTDVRYVSGWYNAYFSDLSADTVEGFHQSDVYAWKFLIESGSNNAIVDTYTDGAHSAMGSELSFSHDTWGTYNSGHSYSFIVYSSGSFSKAYACYPSAPTATPTITPSPTSTPTSTNVPKPGGLPSLFYAQDLGAFTLSLASSGYSVSENSVSKEICPGGDRLAGIKTYYNWNTSGGYQQNDSSMYGYLVLNGATIYLSNTDHPNIHDASQGYSGLATNNSHTVTFDGTNYDVFDLFVSHDDYTYASGAYFSFTNGGDGGTISAIGVYYFKITGSAFLHPVAMCYGTHDPSSPTLTPTPPSCDNQTSFRINPVFPVGGQMISGIDASDINTKLLDFTVMLDQLNLSADTATLQYTSAFTDNTEYGPPINVLIDEYNDSGTQIYSQSLSAISTSPTSVDRFVPRNEFPITAGTTKIVLRFYDYVYIPNWADLAGLRVTVTDISLKLPWGDACTTTNLLGDGGMETYPSSNYWMSSSLNYIGPDGMLYPTSFGRMSATAPWDRFGLWDALKYIFDPLLQAGPACGLGYQVISTNNELSPVQQAFTWPGGPLFWKYRGRGDGFASTHVYITDPNGGIIELSEKSTLGTNWFLEMGSLSDLPAGVYYLHLDYAGDAGDIVIYDDVAIGLVPVSSACDDIPAIIPTPTPNGSPTTIVTELSTRTASPFPPLQTPTGTLPTVKPNDLFVQNCSFESGSAWWGLNQTSQVADGDGPLGSRYLEVHDPFPSANQPVWISQTDTVWISAYVKGSTQANLVNMQTGQSYNLFGTQLWQDWTLTWGHMVIPSGQYYLELGAYSSVLNAGYFDGVQLGFLPTYCAVNLTPTPGVTLNPTATQQHTATVTPTQTPLPTITWFPSNTPDIARTSTAAALTATATLVTPTTNVGATQTEEAQRTATALGTFIPTFVTGTPIGTVPPQPIGGEGAPCEEPTDPLALAAWGGYYECIALRWVSWGPSNSQYVIDQQATWTNLEPLGSIKELGEAGSALGTLSASYSWSNTGLPGQDQAPNSNNFLSPDGSVWNGGFSLRNTSGPLYKQNCSLAGSGMYGPQLSQGMCFIFDILYENDLMPWIQGFFNVSLFIALGIYIKKNFIDKAS